MSDDTKANRDRTWARILWPLLLLVAVVWLLKAGYGTGQWLYRFFHK